MRIITINMQAGLDEKVQSIMFDCKCGSRSEFIRRAVREFLKETDFKFLVGESKIFTVNMDYDMIVKMNEMVESGIFLSRSELIRFATLMKVWKEEKRIKEEKETEEEETKLKPIVKKEAGLETITVPFLDAASMAVYKTYKIIPKNGIGDGGDEEE